MLLDDNSKSRRKGQSFLTRQLVRLLWAILGVARKRWFTSTLLVDNIRELVPRAFVPTPSGAMEDARGAGTGPGKNQESGDVSIPIGDGPGRGLRTRSPWPGLPEVSRLESSWFLEDYQQVKGRAETFVEHAKVGVIEASNNPKALLVFSGGKTRKSAGSLGEGTSYWEVARANRWF